MIVYPKKMLENLNITKGLIFSQEVMLELTKSGLSREQSYTEWFKIMLKNVLQRIWIYMMLLALIS
jgi:adenylosuccinate lyase